MPTITKYIKDYWTGDTLKVVATVKNTGNARIDSINIRALVWQNDQYWAEAGTYKISLDVGQEQTLTWNFKTSDLYTALNTINPNYNLLIEAWGDGIDTRIDTGWTIKLVYTGP
jgi:hypothetical protein